MTIVRAVEDVFAHVADPRYDPQWCGKVLEVRQTAGDGPGLSARYRVIHRPIPLRPAREMDVVCIAYTEPSLLRWRQDDGTDEFVVTYELEGRDGATRLSQRSDARLGAPRVLHPLLRAGIGRDVAAQLKSLKSLLEERGRAAV